MFREYFKALTKRTDTRQLMQFKPPVPPARIYTKQMQLSSAHYQRFCDVVGWSSTDIIHPLYLQMMSVELQMQCLVDKKSPFPVLGLVHVENTVFPKGTVSLAQPLEYRVRFHSVKPHTRGWIVDIKLEVFQHGLLVYEAFSGYLVKAKAVHVAPKPSNLGADKSEEFVGEVLETLNVPSDVGRRYASLSGDYNPIHIHSATAKMFGFKQPIAHGMWTLAKCISVYCRNEPVSFSQIECAFKRPIFLPSNVYVIQQEDDRTRTRLNVTDCKDSTLHLEAKLVKAFSNTP